MGVRNGVHRTQTAVVGNDKGGLEVSHEAPVPEVKEDLVLVRTRAVSVNPVDAKMMGPYVTAGAISGCDFSGVVEEVGPDAAQHGIKIGDRVCAAIMGQNSIEPSLGAFAEHVGARAEGLIKLPETVSFEKGSAFGTSFMTAGLALFKSLNLPGYPLEPGAKSLPVLVYGGSTATGTAAIQLLRLAGFSPVVTCSPHNFELVKSYGAEAVFDYRATDCASAIRSHTRNSLKYALDCISTAESMQICYAALGRAGGRYTALDPYPETVAGTRKIVKADWVLGPIMLGRDIGWPAPHGRPADQDMYAFGVKWRKTVQELLDQGLIREHPLFVQSGGLAGVLQGMEAIRAKKISGKKLVYKMSE
ncbi:putative zinc-binding dehydrogenase family oxidoreductase [Xylona heveae TC161]|uniref:Putative zinc-binding dehydrogenase family oxidoreductase n=1 Tax=Xylona heveae (strain CBS 132557 / TC161) TaxID=1328760 RepID=A0A165HSS5_XYLHT|nr:putative zinc-binding dehydrogenase family oxidoreductase [Xylona heveae TC161]KZF23889.1 putative zinc-binding dehydrogenase family oxidoreductase [Xylona heveae TC161]